MSRVVPPVTKMKHGTDEVRSRADGDGSDPFRYSIGEEILGIVCHIILFTPIIFGGASFALWYGNRYVIYFINLPLAGLFFSVSVIHEVKDVVTQNILLKVLNHLPKSCLTR